MASCSSWFWDRAALEAAGCCWQQVSAFHLTFGAWRVSGVIMEPHCVPAARESAALCLIALQSSRPQAAFPRSAHPSKKMHDQLLNWSGEPNSWCHPGQHQGSVAVFHLTSLNSLRFRLLFTVFYKHEKGTYWREVWITTTKRCRSVLHTGPSTQTCFYFLWLRGNLCQTGRWRCSY